MVRWLEIPVFSEGRTRAIVSTMLLVLILACASGPNASAQSGDLPAETAFAPVRDELVPIAFTLKRAGTTELMSVRRDTSVLLPLRAMFSFLKVRNVFDSASARISGFLISPDTSYLIELTTGRARVGNRTRQLSSGEYEVRGGEGYFSPEFYESMFFLPVEYQPRRLAANLTTRLELPVFLERRLQRYQTQLADRRALEDPEVILPRKFDWLDGFRLDWFISQTLGATRTPVRSASGRLGFTVLGGDFTSRYDVRLSPKTELIEGRNLWRYVPENSKVFRQLLVGDFFTDGLLNRQMYGARISSAPPYLRLMYTDETLTGTLLPDRNVYLFSGSGIAGMSSASSQGRYAVETPLRYGVNLVDVRSYSEWGELTQDSYRINIPQALVPPGEIDYSVTGGRLRERSDPWYGDVSAFWGTSRIVTLGVRTEYFDIDNLPTKLYPSVIGVVRIAPDIVGEVVLSPSALFQGLVTATFPSLLNINSSFTKYREVRLFNPRNAVYDFDFSTSMPFSVNGVRLGGGFLFRQSVLEFYRERLLRASLDAYIGFFYPQISFLSGWVHSYTTGTTRRSVQELGLSLRFRMPGAVFLGLEAGYDLINEELREARVGLALSPVDKLTLEFSYGRTFPIESSIARFELRYIFPFARVVANAVSTRGTVSYGQRASGAIIFSSESGDFFFDSRSRSTLGGFFIRPFVDANDNAVLDRDEEVIVGTRPQASVDGWLTQTSLSRFDRLGWGYPQAVPYRDYFVNLPSSAFDDARYIPRYRNFVVRAKPGIETVYNLPLIIGGGIRGRVFRPTSAELGGSLPVEGIKVRLRQISRDPRPGLYRLPLETTVETFSTGEYSFSGLPPGDYEVSINAAQLSVLGYTAETIVKAATIKPTKDGDFQEAVDFVVTELQ
jgi:hypothetical protein